ncbi:MAG: hypothetical protein ACKPKO_34440, partial [Candidatus Fonsibacter sp.]
IIAQSKTLGMGVPPNKALRSMLKKELTAKSYQMTQCWIKLGGCAGCITKELKLMLDHGKKRKLKNLGKRMPAALYLLDPQLGLCK